MKIRSVEATKTVLKADPTIKKLQSQIFRKLSNYDFDPFNIVKSHYLIHDFFYDDYDRLFFVYKKDNYRLLIYVDIKSETFVIVSFYVKTKNHSKYYAQFRNECKRMVI